MREDLRPGSDVDVLATFSSDADWSLLDHVRMEEEASALFGRKVELVNRKAIERSDNYIRRKAILETAQPYYVARSGHSRRSAESRSVGPTIQGKLTKRAFLRDVKTQSAILYQLLVVGEAVKRLSDSFRAEHDEIP